MTARDAATQADPTDEVEPDDAAATDEAAADAAATTEPATGETAASEAAGEAASKDTATDTDTDADADAAAAGDDTAGGKGRRGRRRRHRETADATTTEPTPPRRWTVWVVAALLVVSALFAGAMVVVYAVTRPDPVAGLTSSQQAAVDAASQAAVNLQTFRRASFDQDFANALASLTPQFAQEQLAPRKDALKQQLSTGGRDASATALSAGLVSSTSSQAVVLVVTNTTQTADDGTSTPFVFSRLQLTLQYTGGKWLVSDLKSVGLS